MCVCVSVSVSVSVSVCVFLKTSNITTQRNIMHIYIYMHISSYKTGKPLTLHVLTPNAKPHVALAKAACNDQREPPSVTRIGNFAAGMDFVHQQFYQHKKNPKGFLLPVSPPQKMKLKYECNKILEVK